MLEGNPFWRAPRRTEYLVHQELHALLLHLYNPADHRLDLDAFLADLAGDQLELASEILENYREGGRTDAGFVLLASSLETATRKVEREYSADRPM